MLRLFHTVTDSTAGLSSRNGEKEQHAFRQAHLHVAYQDLFVILVKDLQSKGNQRSQLKAGDENLAEAGSSNMLLQTRKLAPVNRQALERIVIW